MATHSSVLAWRIPETGDLVGCHLRGRTESDTTEATWQQYIIRNDGLNEAQAGIKIAGRNINNLRYADDTILTAESEEELKDLLDESERGE